MTTLKWNHVNREISEWDKKFSYNFQWITNNKILFSKLFHNKFKQKIIHKKRIKYNSTPNRPESKEASHSKFKSSSTKSRNLRWCVFNVPHVLGLWSLGYMRVPSGWNPHRGRTQFNASDRIGPPIWKRFDFKDLNYVCVCVCGRLWAISGTVCIELTLILRGRFVSVMIFKIGIVCFEIIGLIISIRLWKGLDLDTKLFWRKFIELILFDCNLGIMFDLWKLYK